MHIPVVATTQYAEKIGAILPEVADEFRNVTPMDKMEFNCFANADIPGVVKSLGDDINTCFLELK